MRRQKAEYQFVMITKILSSIESSNSKMLSDLDMLVVFSPKFFRS